MEYNFYDKYGHNPCRGIGAPFDNEKFSFVIKGTGIGSSTFTVSLNETKNIVMSSVGKIPNDDDVMRLELSWNGKKEEIELKAK